MFGLTAKLRVMEDHYDQAMRELRVEKLRGAALKAENQFLRVSKQALQEDLDRVLTHNRELASQPVPTRSNTPLFMSESEEDIRHMRDTEMISLSEAEEMLRSLQFDNETILVDDGLEDVSLY